MSKPVVFRFRGITHDGGKRTANVKVDYDFWELETSEIDNMISELTEAKKQIKRAIEVRNEILDKELKKINK